MNCNIIIIILIILYFVYMNHVNNIIPEFINDLFNNILFQISFIVLIIFATIGFKNKNINIGGPLVGILLAIVYVFTQMFVRDYNHEMFYLLDREHFAANAAPYGMAKPIGSYSGQNEILGGSRGGLRLTQQQIENSDEDMMEKAYRAYVMDANESNWGANQESREIYDVNTYQSRIRNTNPSGAPTTLHVGDGYNTIPSNRLRQAMNISGTYYK